MGVARELDEQTERHWVATRDSGHRDGILEREQKNRTAVEAQKIFSLDKSEYLGL
jgi:hypothetical protein